MSKEKTKIAEPRDEDLTVFAEFELRGDTVRRTVNTVAICTDTESLRWSLGGLRFDIDDDVVHIIATDGRRLCYLQDSVISKSDYVDDIDISATVNVADLVKLKQRLGAKVNSVTVKVLRWGSHLYAYQFQWGNGLNGRQEKHYVARCKCLDGRFPNWRQVLPDPNKEIGFVTFNAKQWVDAWDSFQELRGLSITFDNGAVRAELPNKPLFELQAASGSPFNEVLNHDYLIDHLRSLGDVNVTLRHYSGISPVRIESRGIAYVQMPIAKQ